MTFPPGGFPGGFRGGMPGGFPGGQGGFPGGGFPMPPGFPGQPGGGRPPTPSPGGSATPPPPSQQMINQFQAASRNPAQAQSLLQQGGATRFAAGCDGRWTIVLLRNGQLFLMYVLSSSVTGNTTGIIWPNYTFGSFPSSAIASYSCW